MKLGIKFALLALCLVEIVLLSSLFMTTVLAKRHLADKRHDAHQNAVRHFAAVCRDALADRNDIPVLNYMKSASPIGVEYYVVADADGKVRLHSDLLRGDRSSVGKKWDDGGGPKDSVQVRDKIANGKSLVEWSAPVLIGNSAASAAYIGYSRAVLDADLNRDVGDIVSRFLYLGLGLSVLSLAGSMFLAWRLNRPIQDLAEGARRMGQGDLEYRILPRSRDELGALAHSFNDMAEQLQRLGELREQTISSITHDLRAPLGAILSNAQLLRAQAPKRLKPEDLTCLDAIGTNVQRISDMSQDILDLAKMKAGKFIVRKQPVALDTVVSDAIGVVSATAKLAGVHIAKAIGEDIPKVAADQVLILRVLVNLLSNALRFTPDGGAIAVEATLNGGDVEVAVMDTGVGIPEQYLGLLFTHFTQVPPDQQGPSKGQGTGLGLAICKEIVVAHKGRIWATSAVGRGTTVHFTLPLHA